MATVGVVRAAAFVVVLALVLAGLLWHTQLELSDLRDFFATAGAWAPLAFVTAYVLATLVWLPGPMLTMTGGLLFGAVWGTLFSLIGALVGGVLAFLIARHVARDWFERRLGPSLRPVKRGVEDEGGWFVLFARLMPVVPYAALNYGFGLTRIRLLPYALGSLVGMVPATAGYSFLGDAGLRVLEGDSAGLKTGLIIIGVFAALIFVPRLIRRIRARRGESRPPSGTRSDA